MPQIFGREGCGARVPNEQDPEADGDESEAREPPNELGVDMVGHHGTRQHGNG